MPLARNRHNTGCRCNFCARIPVGYQGQKYEVKFQRQKDGPWETFGWQNTPTGGMVTAVEKWPEAVSVQVVEVSIELRAPFLKQGEA